MIPLVKQLAVIMARGESLRMGRPKGLCRLGHKGENFVTRVIRLYHGLEIPTLLVVRPEDEAAYKAVAAEENTEILKAPGGGDTALTMKLALEWAESRGLKVDFFWAHPVDLPLVSVKTISDLLTASCGDESAAWRPFFKQTPGHPVLIPEASLTLVLNGDLKGSSMSRAWKKATAEGLVGPIRSLVVDDKGAITDFDTPEQLNSSNNPKESGS